MHGMALAEEDRFTYDIDQNHANVFILLTG